MWRRLAGMAIALVLGAPIAWAQPLTWGPVVTRTARGCDAFTPVRAADGHHYTAFGDCGGLTGRLPKLSMGFGRIIGGPVNARVQDLPTATLRDYGNGPAGMKPSSAIIVGKRMYMWVRNYGPNGTQARLKYSDDYLKGANSTWRWSSVRLTRFGYPVFVQGVTARYVYIVVHDDPSAYVPADRFLLFRVPSDKLLDRGSYEFFSGTPASPAWSKIHADARAIFAARDQCYRSGMSYNRARNRYYWWQNKGRKFTNNSFEIWSAPKPWGPFTRLYRAGPDRWDVNPGERGEFPVAWMGPQPISQPGTMHLLFSGHDQLMIRRVTIARGY